MSKFADEIKKAVIEREVEDIYNKGINLYFPNSTIEHPFACDGLIDTKTSKNKVLKLIIEYKFEEEFSSSVSRAKVIVQVLYYLKKFEQNGLILPNVVMVGDINECFVFHTNDIIKYLDEDLDWSVAPSNAHKSNPDLVLKISKDETFNPFIFEIGENFSFKEVADKIIDLADNVQRYVHVTEHNIATIFDYFSNRVIKDKKKISSNDLVAIFMGVITDKENYYQHPSKKGSLITPNQTVNIDGNGFTSFFEYFNRNYTPQEKNKFSEISDRLIEDTNRRNKGEFYTPTLFVDYSHKMLTEQFGENWKEDYVVWDCCCGTKNLTRDYRFKELYCSTLENAELEISKRYNPEATSFQFDFLNDSMDKLPKGLLNAFEENKPILFFINPPYATACIKSRDEITREGITKTMVNLEMNKDQMGGCSESLYAQFLYRILKIKQNHNNINIGLFSPSLFLTGSSYTNFRAKFLPEFKYENGILFQASHFSDVASNWGISFTVWSNGVTLNRDSFAHTIVDNTDGEIKPIDTKIIYNLDYIQSASKWIREEIKGLKTFDTPNTSSGIKIKNDDKTRGRSTENALGYFLNASNHVDKNIMDVALFSTSYSNGNGLSILPTNFNKCMSLFSARKLVGGNWINSKDEYLTPNTEYPKYQEFETDSIIYSLFNTASNQSSLRNIEYKGKKWGIKNEFFWLSKTEMLNLSNEHSNDTCYYDAQTDTDRYVYNLLKTTELSPEAQIVLDKASELVRKSFKYREMFNEEHPEYHINSWDCGWYQIKAVCKEYLSNDLKEFNTLYKALGDEMRPMVYELGFLK